MKTEKAAQHTFMREKNTLKTVKKLYRRAAQRCDHTELFEFVKDIYGRISMAEAKKQAGEHTPQFIKALIVHMREGIDTCVHFSLASDTSSHVGLHRESESGEPRSVAAYHKQAALSRIVSRYKQLHPHCPINHPSVPDMEERIKSNQQWGEVFQAYAFLSQIARPGISFGCTAAINDCVNVVASALRASDLAKANQSLSHAGKLLGRIAVMHVPDVDANGNTYRSRLEISGVSHQLMPIEILINGTPMGETCADGNGRFLFENIHMQLGENKVTIRPARWPFLMSRGASAFSMIISRNPFKWVVGRIDPITRTPFQAVPIKELVRCQRCCAFHLKQSWSDFGLCPLCSGEAFYKHDEPEFYEMD